MAKLPEYKSKETSLNAKTGHKIHVTKSKEKQPKIGEKVIINKVVFEVVDVVRFCTAKKWKAGLTIGISGNEVKK